MPRREIDEELSLQRIALALRYALSAEEFDTLVFDYFRQVYVQFSNGMSNEQRLIRLLEWCDKHGKRKELHDAILTVNSVAFAITGIKDGQLIWDEEKVARIRGNNTQTPIT